MTAPITFAIPFHRDIDLLRLAVESVLAQTSPDWQLLVCDDSGLDLPVEAMLGSYAEPRISYIKNSENIGMVKTWNRCLDHAESDLVNLLHADDTLLPNYAELMLSLAATHSDATAFFCETEIVAYDGSPKFSLADRVKGFLVPRAEAGELVLRGEAGVASLMAGYFIMTPTLCYRKSLLRGRRFDPAYKQVQDLVFIVDLLMSGHSLVGSRERAYTYRRHEGSATSRQSQNMLRFDEEIVAFDRIAERARELGWERAERVSKRKRIIKLHLLYRALRELIRLRPAAALEVLRYLLRVA
ncbi:MAG: glycosyltransferase family 2 protein [Deltaproteobacteria bacterium]|nr:glycosyltransferase family 2 protein [Deltaproteobacteria bacterium]